MSESDAPDRALSVSHEALVAFAEWGKRLRSTIVGQVESRQLARHQELAAASLLRVPNLCDAIRKLGENALHHEAATLVRVTVELAINSDWIGKDDERAWILAHDLEQSVSRMERAWKEHLGLEPPPREPIITEPLKGLPSLRDRVKTVNPDLLRLYAGIYTMASEPTHGALIALRHIDDQSFQAYGRGVAALGVQAAAHLIGFACRYMPIHPDIGEIKLAFTKWKESK